ncbi:hypothetical protein [Colwellia sp. TT2012]|uniref:hypothetical protein n=1 Tax=Colwellia sp. TT2012 TaxID=1720342 RepID=UPI000A482366|nr:hypothetical protein [Colwellia sp. TT2012]
MPRADLYDKAPCPQLHPSSLTQGGAAAAAEELSHQAKQLQEMLKRFKLMA